MFLFLPVSLPCPLAVTTRWTEPQNGSMSSNSPFKERRGEGAAEGGGREENKCLAMQTVKRVQSALQQFNSTSWAESQWLPADRPFLISGLLTAASAALPSLLAAALFKPPPALSSACL